MLRVDPVYVSLLRMNVPESKHEDSDRGDHNVNDFWDIVEITRENGVVILVTVAILLDLTAPYRIYEVIQNNEDKMWFTNQDLIAFIQ